MTQKVWNRLSFFEQLSNIDGEVRRLVEAHDKYVNGINPVDYAPDYLITINRLLKMTMFDPKNYIKGYRFIELNDEINEINRYLNGEVTGDYILSYWDEYTKAIS